MIAASDPLRPKRPRRLFGAATAGLAAMLLAACGIPQPEMSRKDFAAGHMPVPMATLEALHFIEAGDRNGRRVVFVHGTPGDASAFADFLASVPKGLHYVAVDRPGFGLTGGPSMVSLKDQAAALRPLLEPNEAGRPILVGHSLGGPIVARAAVDFADMVGGIVIVAGSLDPAQEKILFIQRVGDAWPIRTMIPRVLRNSNEELMALKPELEALAERLPELRTPTIIIHGKKDTLVPFANVPFMLEKIPAESVIDMVILDEGDHFLPWNAKTVIDETIVALAARGS